MTVFMTTTKNEGATEVVGHKRRRHWSLQDKLQMVRGNQVGTQVARGLPEAAINEFGGFALAKVLGAGTQIVNGVIRSERSLLNAELKTAFNSGPARDLPLAAPLEGISTSIPLSLRIVNIQEMQAPLWTEISIFNTYPEKTTLQLSSAAEQAQFLATHVPELSEVQARMILDKAFIRDSSVVFGGSRLRGDFPLGGFGVGSDIDVGFGGLKANLTVSQPEDRG